MFSSNTSQVSNAANYIEDVFSTYLYTGNAPSTNTINNGIDLSGKGGMTWLKRRDGAVSHSLFDTNRGDNILQSNSTAQAFNGPYITFNSDGFTLANEGQVNANGFSNVSWTFRKQPKFFDVVTWTGNGANYRAISHSLGSTPGCVIVKSTSASGAWAVWHQSVDPKNLILNSTSAAITGQFSIQDVGATTFAVANSSFYGFPQSIPVNDNGATYVAYVFANNAGGFGLTGTDNVISCGSYSGTGSVPNDITLGFEPQWLLVKNTTSSGQEWGMFDNMRGLVTGTDGDAQLFANASSAENISAYFRATATGFACEDASTRYNASGNTYIYIAIRRGPMKVPTSGTSVFSPIARTGTGATATVTGVGFPPDLVIPQMRDSATFGAIDIDRLRGFVYLAPPSTQAEAAAANSITSFNMDGVTLGTDTATECINKNAKTYINWFFRRAPSFFDEVCYTGTGVAGRTVAHNLTVAPELIIVKSRSLSGEQWPVYASPITVLKVLQLNTTIAATTYSGYWNNTAPTSSVFSVSDTSTVNQNGATFVAYLFATCAGVSKVFSYTGNGSSQTINCGFTGGARFVLIKRTDSTGDWYVWDSARGIVSENDPHLSLNTTAAEVTTDDSVDTDSTGFIVNQIAATNINVSSATYIGIAIA